MKISLSELIVQRPLTRFISAVPLLTDVYVAAHNWNADDIIYQVYKRKRDFVINKLLILNKKSNKFEVNVRSKGVFDHRGYPDKDPETGEQKTELDLEESDVNLIELIRYMVNERKEIDILPDELLIAAGIEPPERNTSNLNSDEDGELNQNDAFYEDIITDETILKLKNMTLPQMKHQVAILTEDKKKCDAAVMAAAKIGLLFCEEGLQKPATQKKFVAEYKKHLDKFPGLHDTTIKRIYKNLPEGYRFSRDGGKLSSDQVDILPIIKAAVFAGSIYDTDDVKDLGKLKADLTEFLKEHNCELPSDDVLLKIIEATKDI
jgi:hypothetical protein